MLEYVHLQGTPQLLKPSNQIGQHYLIPCCILIFSEFQLFIVAATENLDSEKSRYQEEAVLSGVEIVNLKPVVYVVYITC